MECPECGQPLALTLVSVVPVDKKFEARVLTRTEMLAEQGLPPISMRMELDEAEGMFGPHDWEGTPARSITMDTMAESFYAAGTAVYGTHDDRRLEYLWQRQYRELGMGLKELLLSFREDAYDPCPPDLLVVEVGVVAMSVIEDALEQVFGDELSSWTPASAWAN